MLFHVHAQFHRAAFSCDAEMKEAQILKSEKKGHIANFRALKNGLSHRGLTNSTQRHEKAPSLLSRADQLSHKSPRSRPLLRIATW